MANNLDTVAAITTAHRPRATSLDLMVRSPHQLVFQGKVKAVSSVDEKGLFDVLPEHVNFISLVKDLLVVHAIDGKQQELKIGQGLLKVFDNKIFVYLIS